MKFSNSYHKFLKRSLKFQFKEFASCTLSNACMREHTQWEIFAALVPWLSYIYIYGFWRTFNLYQPKVRFIFYANNLDTCNLKEYIKLMLANLLFSFSSFWKKVPNSLLITLMRELLLKNIFLVYSNKPTECCRTSHSQQTVFSGKSKLEFLVELIKACKSDNSMLFNLWITWEVKWKGIMEICNSHFFLIKTKLHVFVHTQKWKIHFYSFFQAYKISEKPRPCDWESLNCWE